MKLYGRIFIIIAILCIFVILLKHFHFLYLTQDDGSNKPILNQVTVLHSFLDEKTFQGLKLLLGKTEGITRTNTIIRKGSSISYQQLSKSTGNSKELLLQLNKLDSLNTLQSIETRTGLRLQFTPRTDPNRLSVIYYDKPKDTIGWHYDGNNYYGNRWVGIYTIINQNSSKTSPSSAKFEYVIDGKTHSFHSPENSLVLFRGDKIKHRVTPIAEGDKRIVVSMVLCDICERSLNPLKHLYQTVVNIVFYGNI